MTKNSNQDDSSIHSKLKLNHLVCDELRFKRTGFRTDNESDNLRVSYRVEEDSGSEYRCSLGFNVVRESEFEATVRITGYFSVDENDPMKDVLLSQNAVAILFPYARSQMTILTSQPETTPVVLPVINVQKMIEQSTPVSTEDDSSPSE